MKKTKRNTKTTNEKEVKIKYEIRLNDNISVTYIVYPLCNVIDKEYYDFTTNKFRVVKNAGITLKNVAKICDRYAYSNRRVLVTITNIIHNYSNINSIYRSYNGMVEYKTTHVKMEYAF